MTESLLKRALTIFKGLLENCILFHCRINLKVVLYRNRMKSMEKLLSNRRKDAAVKLSNVFVIMIFCWTTVSARPKKITRTQIQR